MIHAQGSRLKAQGKGNCLQPRAFSLQRGSALIVFIGLWSLAVDCWADAPVRVWLPEGITTTSPLIDRLFYVILAITGIVFLGVQATLLWFLVRYRKQPGRPAHYTHGNTAVEIVWTIIPSLILIFLAVYSQRVWSSVRGTPPLPDLELEITAEQFAWNIRYAGTDGKLNTDDDITTINQLHVPVNQTVLISLKSKDVIHSFFVPQFRMKLDAVPGLTGHLWVQTTKTGHYEIACAELCGLGHYRMRGFLTVEPASDFHTWLKTLVTE